MLDNEALVSAVNEIKRAAMEEEGKEDGVKPTFCSKR